MIGQQQIKSFLKSEYQNNKLAHFIILVGDRGSGKKTLLKELFESGIWLEDIKVGSVRSLVAMAYSNHSSIFILPDADSMSNAAKNALLKVVEESPNNNFFIMTLEDEYNTLPTIRSRANIYYMQYYTPDEMSFYFQQKYSVSDDKLISIVREICSTPGDVDLLQSFGISEFYDYVNLVVNHIAKASGSNVFKITNKLCLKEGDGGYDLKLFWKAFIQLVYNRGVSSGNLLAIQVTEKYISMLRLKSMNKQMLVDTWILDIRKLWL